MKPENILIDVICLSQKNCLQPIKGELRYATHKNFIGRIIDGYTPDAIDVCLLAGQAAAALCKVQNYLIENFDFGLLIYDAYRPLRAVQDFAKWCEMPIQSSYELERKVKHYPNLEKNQLPKLGYIAIDVSKHCYGSTIDLVLIDIKSGNLLDMGARFDLFDSLSHTDVAPERIGVTADKHRQILSDAMQKYGYIPYEKEFWHFDYFVREIEEPINIKISSKLKGLNVDTIASAQNNFS